MKEQLIKLAKEKGFDEWLEIPYQDDNDGWTYYYEPHNDDRCYYLWMCELQKWLRDKHFLHIYVVPYGENEGWILANIRNLKLDLLVDKKDIEARMHSFNTYEQALEKGLFESLKLLK